MGGERELCECDAFRNATRSGTDSEGYGSLIFRTTDGWEMGDGLPALAYCPWCGKRVPQMDSEPAGSELLIDPVEVAGESWRRSNPDRCPVFLRPDAVARPQLCECPLKLGACPLHGRIYVPGS